MLHKIFFVDHIWVRFLILASCHNKTRDRSTLFWKLNVDKQKVATEIYEQEWNQIYH